MKCMKCEQLQMYDHVDSRDKLEQYRSKAFNYVETGVLRVDHDYQSCDHYSEKMYTCNHCGTKFVLWLDDFFLRAGGEWRTLIKPLNN